jgi:hypothetical protein
VRQRGEPEEAGLARSRLHPVGLVSISWIFTSAEKFSD